MSNRLRIILLAFLIILPIVFYNTLNKRGKKSLPGFASGQSRELLPAVALIFDDLGESLADLKELYSLDIPLTISVIPGLRFSRNIAHIGARCGFSVFIHLPLEPKKRDFTKNTPYRFIGSQLSIRDNQTLLRKYLNSIRIAIGVNNHMGSLATEDPELMNLIVKEVKSKGLIFVDSRTSQKSVAYEIANAQSMACAYNQGFLDSVSGQQAMKENFDSLIESARLKGQIIVIAHPRKSTLEFLKNNLAEFKKEVRFITAKEYFQL